MSRKMTARRSSGLSLATIAGLVLAVAMIDRGQAQETVRDAETIMKAMSDYLASQKTIAFDFDTELEIVTPFSQKLQFDSSGKVELARPAQFRAQRTGGYVDAELVSDGKTVTLLGKNIHKYAQLDTSGSFDQVIEDLRTKYGADLPAADFFVSDPYHVLLEDVIEAKHIGRGVIDGVECEHLAFRNIDTDWQLWVRVGDKPIPCKYLITSKTVGEAPQYAIRFKNWKTDITFAPDAFTFKPPADAQRVDAAQLPNLDEIPDSAPVGGQK